jgi:hypothetical protein
MGSKYKFLSQLSWCFRIIALLGIVAAVVYLLNTPIANEHFGSQPRAGIGLSGLFGVVFVTFAQFSFFMGIS